jgi:hypothetical protein
MLMCMVQSQAQGLVSPQIISRIANEARVIVNDEARELGQGFAALHRVQMGTAREVGHPQAINRGRLGAFGAFMQRLAQLLAARLGVELVLAQEALDGVERRKLRGLLARAPVEHFDRHGRMGLAMGQTGDF